MHLDHVGLVVADLDAMTGWWSVALGAGIEYTVERPGIAMRATVLQAADGFRLELLHRVGSEPAHGAWDVPASLMRHGYGHVGLAVDDVAEAFDRLVTLGAAPVMAPADGSRPGMTIAFVADPEHNLVELVHRRADAAT